MKFIRHLLVAVATIVGMAAASAQNISIATGGTGGVYYPLGGGLAAVLSKSVPGMQATAEVTDDMLRRARSKFGHDARLRLSSGSLTALPLDDASVDALMEKPR